MGRCFKAVERRRVEQWTDMSRESFRAAAQLRRLKWRRSCVSRAYYAAFAAVTAEVRKRERVFPGGYAHPPHKQMSRYIKRYLTHLPKRARRELATTVGRLYAARLDAELSTGGCVR